MGRLIRRRTADERALCDRSEHAQSRQFEGAVHARYRRRECRRPERWHRSQWQHGRPTARPHGSYHDRRQGRRWDSDGFGTCIYAGWRVLSRCWLETVHAWDWRLGGIFFTQFIHISNIQTCSPARIRVFGSREIHEVSDAAGELAFAPLIFAEAGGVACHSVISETHGTTVPFHADLQISRNSDMLSLFSCQCMAILKRILDRTLNKSWRSA